MLLALGDRTFDATHRALVVARLDRRAGEPAAQAREAVAAGARAVELALDTTDPSASDTTERVAALAANPGVPVLVDLSGAAAAGTDALATWVTALVAAGAAGVVTACPLPAGPWAEPPTQILVAPPARAAGHPEKADVEVEAVVSFLAAAAARATSAGTANLILDAGLDRQPVWLRGPLLHATSRVADLGHPVSVALPAELPVEGVVTVAVSHGARLLRTAGNVAATRRAADVLAAILAAREPASS